jgi:hypothetical protein
MCSPAWATTVKVIKGGVSINQSDGFRRVVGSTQVYPGNRVMADKDGQAKIVYADGCAIDVYPGAVVTVPQKCYQPMRAGLESKLEPVVEERPPYLLYGAIAAGVGVGICAAAGCFDDDDGRPGPSSP